MKNKSERMSAAEAAEYAGCGKCTIYSAYHEGALKGYSKFGMKKGLTFKEEDLERWLDGLPPLSDEVSV